MATLSNKPTSIIVVDNHDIVRKGIRLLINEQPEFVVSGEAGTKNEAILLIEQMQPDIVILDLDLGQERGQDLIAHIRINSPHTRILIFTGVRDINAHREAVQAGAVGLVHKDQPVYIVVEALKRVSAGEAWINPVLIANVLNELSRAPGVVTDPELQKIARLTDREREVIQLVCEGRQNRVIGESLFISETTVRHHLTSIFAKLSVENRLELVIYAFRHGLAQIVSPLENK